MANIIRCKLPDGIHRFKPFTVADYRDFLLVRNDMLNKPDQEQYEIIDELTQDYFEALPESWRHYAFLNVFTGSIGKTKIPIVYQCPTCGKNHKRIFNIEQQPLTNPVLEVNEDTQIKFKFPEKIDTDLNSLVLNNINTVVYEGTEYNWDDLDPATQSNIIDSVDFKQFESLIKTLKPIHFSLNLTCCETRKMVYDDLKSIFMLLINPDEVFTFYEINHILSKNKYSISDIMSMIPIERSIALSLIEKDSK